ncbi:hypothetical protein [Gloeothece verrucosa]|uniref:Uncharacterized protein n=1 Tax=Gloeothece verrucosa (strain PCC 7822) TaxID=497965 RepID=E0UMU8_GLOV7|nr:hypothetical protein [Gloeothece verrucosa]ADN18278.1 hypothetical protein Cyan7822_6504 [Gloeothece verrucosa PCC 7822]
MTVSGATVARPKVTVYFNPDVYEWLNAKAEREIRSIANCVEYLVTKAKEQEEASQKSSEEET